MIDNTSMNNTIREGRFTSSMVYKLIPMGSTPMTPDELADYKIANPGSKKRNKPAGFTDGGLTYIQEKVLERRFKSCLDSDAYSQIMAWGNIMEMYVYGILGLEYEIASKETVMHPDSELAKYWSGSVDMLVRQQGVTKVVSEIKCYWKKNFGLYVDCLKKQSIPVFKQDFPKEYWQIVSNAIIHECDYGEAVCFMPYESQHPDILQMVDMIDGDDIWKYRFIVEKPMRSLPFLPDDGYYENVNKFRFKIPRSDKMLLTRRIKEAAKLLDNDTL